MNNRAWVLFVAAISLSGVANAGSGFAIEAGQGEDASELARISLVRQWSQHWFDAGSWYLGGYWEAAAGRWHSTAPGGKTMLDVALTPVFRLQDGQPLAGMGLRPYFEAAVGAHVLSHTHVNDRHDLGCAFQFGDHLGLGVVFGAGGRYDLSYRFQHLSNAQIKEPNDGINFQEIHFAYWF